VIGTASSIGPVKIKLHYSLANVIDTPGRIFAVCHQCGSTFYEGSHSIRKLEQLKLSSQKKRSDDNVTLVAADDESGSRSLKIFFEKFHVQWDTSIDTSSQNLNFDRSLIITPQNSHI
jgi:hypothetical protein